MEHISDRLCDRKRNKLLCSDSHRQSKLPLKRERSSIDVSCFWHFCIIPSTSELYGAASLFAAAASSGI